VTPKSRAIVLVCCAAATTLALTLIVIATLIPDLQGVVTVLTAVVGCAVVSWASAKGALADVTRATELATVRVVEATAGDLTSATPLAVGAVLPRLADALDAMFARVRDNMQSATSLARFDPITLLGNRIHFHQEGERAIKGLPEGVVSALFFIDLDNFKTVNDTLGHGCGDQALMKMANRLRAVAASQVALQGGAGGEPIVGRYAGDEFTLFVPHVGGRDDAARIGEQLVSALAKPFDFGGQQVTVGGSIGIALSPEHGSTLTALISAADVAMYHAKASGRGRFQFYAELLAERIANRSRLEVELRQALTRNEFMMVFQPQVTLSDGRVRAVEGLLRWNHPVDGLRTPESFIEAAEDSGLIVELGDWAIDALARRIADWPTDPLAPKIAVNLSSRQIARPEFFGRLHDALARSRARLSLIEFEVREALLMECRDDVLEQIRRLQREGATIVIDAFGSGSSSLSRLRSLPFDLVKLDASLVAGIESDPAARAMAQAVISLVHGLGAKAIASGVETAAQYDMLRVMGCDGAQGQVIAPPMAEADYRAWVGNTPERMSA
jgi:diguanylate cyclase (GGDEF)-like protein